MDLHNCKLCKTGRRPVNSVFAFFKGKMYFCALIKRKKDVSINVMNGLVAIFKKNNFLSSSLKCLLEKGLDTLSHRGDKTSAYFLMNWNLQNAEQAHEPACLAMGTCSRQNQNRLTDATSLYNASHVATEEGNILFFEGRLLNKKELCQSLSMEALNERPDAEVVLRMFKRHGVNSFSLLKGFWSLICLDADNKTLYGARDHFGNRPLWYCNTGKHFVLASECRTIYTLFEDTHSINRNMVVDYLLWGNIGLSDQYFFNDIHSIEPSHFVKYEMESDRLVVERYYTIPYNRSNRHAYRMDDEKHFTEMLLAHLTCSVKKNLSLFDGTMAVGVSGGMDSSSLLCLAQKIDPDRRYVAYTATDTYDGGEMEWAEKVVRYTGVEWIKVTTTAEHIMEQLAVLNRVHSAPVYNTSSLAQYRVMEEVKKQGQTVFLDGQGGDELLGGYPAYFPLFLQLLRNNGDWKRWWTEWIHTDNSGMTRKEILMRRLKLWAKAHYYSTKILAQKKRKYEYESLTSKARDDYFNNPMSIPVVEKEVINDALFESYTFFLGNIIRWGEHSAASQGVECVMPFSDLPDLTEFVFSIPSSFKIHQGWNKYLLRKAMAGIVPDKICSRKQKMGFYVPEQKWLNDIKKPLFDTLNRLKDPEECIRMKYIMENLNQLYLSANPLYQQFIFRCYSYLLWRNNL